jgi:hypothetical protein
MWHGYAKTLFWASGRDTARALLVVTALTIYGLMPLAGTIRALVTARGADRRSALRHAAWRLVPMILVRAWVCRLLRIPLAYAVLYPVAVLAGNALVLYSIYRVRSGKGVEWKGRVYR